MQWFTEVVVVVGIMLSMQAMSIRTAWAFDPAGHAALHRVVTPSSEVVQKGPPYLVAQLTDQQLESFRYQSEGRRDPFESLLKEEAPGDIGPVDDPARPRGPLERFDLSSLQLTGIVWGRLGRRAVIRAPDGKGYFVTVGMYMGQNGGQVVEVEDQRLVIQEKHRDVKGRIIDKTLSIPLRRKE